MNDLPILIARLGWPSTSARWWTIQELAARLGESAVRADTEFALLQLISSRKLEAEVVEVLCIFWMAANGHGYSPAKELAESILKPSLLANQVLASIKLLVQVADMTLKEVPEGFEIPDDFDGVQGVDLPMIFQTSMNRLETYSGLPFVRQMAFEWIQNRKTYPDAPYQGDSGYFRRPLGDGFIGQLSARVALRAISAYLRALAVAKQYWRMPSDLADKESLLALPIHPTLAFLRSHRPAWFPAETDFYGNTEEIDASLRSLLARVEDTRSGDELIAFTSPVMMSTERCVEVSLVRWLQESGSNVDDANLAAHLDTYWTYGQALSSTAAEPLSTTTTLAPPTFEQLVDIDSKAWPLAATLDFDRIGYLQHDLYPSRLFFPTMSGLHNSEITPQNGHLKVNVNNQAVADFFYWNAGWGMARPKQLSGNCGTALISCGKTYREGVHSDSESLRTFYLWQVRTLHRSRSFGDFSETLEAGVLFV